MITTRLRTVLLCLLALHWTRCAFAQDPAALNLKVVAVPPAEARTLTMTGDTSDVQLSDKFPFEGKLRLETVERRASMLSVQWGDGSSTSFPLNLSTVFSGSKVDVVFYRAPPIGTGSAGVSAACLQRSPTTVMGSFDLLFSCKNIALKIEADDPRLKWTEAHRIALTGWLNANDWLYLRVKPIGPYGYDPDLLTRLREAVMLVDERGYSPGTLKPLDLATVRNALARVAQEDIRLAGAIPELVAQRRYGEAEILNNFVSSRFEQIAAERGVRTVLGVNRDLLDANAKFIRSLGPS
jgi:hypothetical protein